MTYQFGEAVSLIGRVPHPDNDAVAIAAMVAVDVGDDEARVMIVDTDKGLIRQPLPPGTVQLFSALVLDGENETVRMQQLPLLPMERA